MGLGLRGTANNPASPPYTQGPYTWDQHVTFSGGVSGLNTSGDVIYVDGTNGSDGNTGLSWTEAKSTIQAAVTLAGAKGTVYVAPKAMAAGATDPGSYEENVIIPATHESLSIIGVNRGRTQGGLPQMKDGSGTTTAILIIRSPGCLIQNMGFNGAGNTGGGISLDDDASTKSAFGTTITGCHFKNCKGHATNGTLGGAIMWAIGGAWQVYITNNTFYKCVCDICLIGTGTSVPQDVVIANNVFSAPVASVDVNLYLAGGSGMASVTVDNNVFPSALPAIGSGTVTRYADMTGCSGIFSNNTFGGSYTTTGFGAAKAAAKLPTTVGISHNYSDAGLIVREA